MENILFDEKIHDYVDKYLDGLENYSGVDKDISKLPLDSITKWYSYDKFTVGKIYEFKSENYNYTYIFEILEIITIKGDDDVYFKYILLFSTNPDNTRQPGYKRRFLDKSDIYRNSSLLEDQSIP